MGDLETVIEDVTPVGDYDTHDELAADVRTLVMASNPMGEAGEQGARYSGAVDEVSLGEVDDIGSVGAEELRETFEEWERVRSGLATRYRRRARYFEWEYRRAFVLERLADHSSERFGAEESAFADRHRIAMEVRMWAAYCKHLLLDVESGDLSLAGDEFGFVDVDTKHSVSEAVMTSSSLFESVGKEILVRNHGYDRDSHLSMNNTNQHLKKYDYFGAPEYRLVDDFRSDVRNKIAHDVLRRSRLDQFEDFRSDVIRPCWDVVDLTKSLTESEIEPDD